MAKGSPIKESIRWPVAGNPSASVRIPTGANELFSNSAVCYRLAKTTPPSGGVVCLVRPAGRTHLGVQVPYGPDRGNR